MNNEEFLIEKSCESYVLKKVPFLISSFPGYIVFGETYRGQVYIKNKCLKFNFFDFSTLSECILNCIKFIAEENNSTDLQPLIKNKNVTYLWQGFITNIENESEKNIKFIILNGLERHDLIFSVIEFNNFILVLKRCFLSCLCLKDKEEQFVNELLEKEATLIQLCKKTYSVANDFVESYLKSQCSINHKKATLIELLRYHNECFVVLKKLQEISFEEDSQSS
jgi:hypothetical protein